MHLFSPSLNMHVLVHSVLVLNIQDSPHKEYEMMLSLLVQWVCSDSSGSLGVGRRSGLLPVFWENDSWKTLMGALMAPLGWPQMIERLQFKRTQGNVSHFGEVWISITNLYCILEPFDDLGLHNALKITRLKTLIEEIKVENIVFLLINVWNIWAI